MPQNLAPVRIAYYISDYGYGHATRSIAIIRELMRRLGEESIRITVCCNKALTFIRSSLHEFDGEQVQYRQVASDIGYALIPGTLESDIAALHKRNAEYWQEAPRSVRMEQAFLRSESIRLVVSDISPIPLMAAAGLGIQSVGISNFTWYTAYERMMGRPMREQWRRAYNQMDAFIALPGSAEPDWGKGHKRAAGFYCRRPEQSEVDRLLAQYNPDRSKLIVYFALGMSITASDMDEMAFWQDDRCLFIVSSNMEVRRPNAIQMPADYTESQNYVAISDLVITKPGWGTVAEAVCLAVPLLLVQRDTFAEEERLIDSLDQYAHPYCLMNWNSLKQHQLNRAGLEAMRCGISHRRRMSTDSELVKITEYLINDVELCKAR